jgi:hypothetical protein
VRAKAAAEVENMTKATSCPPPPKDALAMQLEAEMRTRLAAMREDERRKFVGVSFGNRDALVMAAVLRHPALIGMGEAEFAVCRDRYRRSEFPQEADRLERLTKGVAALDRAGKCFVNLVETAAKNPAAEAAEQNAAKVKKLEAAE